MKEEGKLMSTKKVSAISVSADIPYLMSAKHLEQLGFGRTMVYELMKTEGFPVLHVGNRKLVPKDAFMEWLHSKINTPAASPTQQYS